MTGPGVAAGAVLVRFPTHPHSVRTARQLVTDTLRAWELEPFVDDARLVVTELTTNATLHSGAPSFMLKVTPTAGVRIAVGDDGPVPVAAVVRRSRARDRTTTPRRPEATTGRGLAIVDELASAWGVDVDGTTKWVWAELTSGDVPASGSEAPSAAPAAAAPLPPGWHVVRLLDCPVVLSLASDDHLDDLVRELQLIGPRDGEEPALASVIRGLLDGQAQARHLGRRTAQDAAAEGREHVEVVMVLPARAADEVERLHAAVAAADALCEREQLLTLASPPAVRELRAWLRDEVRDQIRHGRPPQPYDGRTAAARD